MPLDLPAILGTANTKLGDISPEARNFKLTDDSWELNLKNNGEAAGKLVAGINSKATVQVFNNEKNPPDPDGILKVPSDVTAVVENEDSDARLALPPLAEYQKGDAWVKVRAEAGGDFEANLGVSGINASIAAEANAAIAVYRRYAADDTVAETAWREFNNVIQAVAEKPYGTAVFGEDTMLGVRASAGLKASISVDLIEMAGLMAGAVGGVAARLSGGALKFGPKFEISCGFSTSDGYVVALRRKSQGTVRVVVRRAVERGSSRGLDAGVSVKLSRGDEFKASIREFLGTVTEFSWSQKAVDALEAHTRWSAVTENKAELKDALETLVEKAGDQLGLTEGDLAEAFAIAKKWLENLNKLFAENGGIETSIEASLNASYTMGASREGVIDAVVKASLLAEVLPSLVSGDLDPLLKLHAAGKVEECSFLGQEVKTETRSIQLGLKIFGLNLKGAKKQTMETSVLTAWDSNSEGGPLSQRACRWSWTHNREVKLPLDLFYKGHESFAQLIALQPALVADDTLDGFDYGLKLQWRISYKSADETELLNFAHAGAMFGLWPATQIPERADAIEKALKKHSGKVELLGTLEAKPGWFYDEIGLLANATPEEWARACTLAMPWHDTKRNYRTDPRFIGAYESLWLHILQSCSFPKTEKDFKDME